jgi:hypothetical protein
LSRHTTPTLSKRKAPTIERINKEPIMGRAEKRERDVKNEGNEEGMKRKHKKEARRG